jgi:hypothetical protein
MCPTKQDNKLFIIFSLVEYKKGLRGARRSKNTTGTQYSYTVDVAHLAPLR